jgi:hypothetical protein
MRGWEEALAVRSRAQRNAANPAIHVDADFNGSLNGGPEDDISANGDAWDEMQVDINEDLQDGVQAGINEDAQDIPTQALEHEPENVQENVEPSAIDPAGENTRQVVDDNSTLIFEDHYPGAASVIQSAPPAFFHLYDEQVERGEGNMHYPFAGPKEWEVARWLHNSGLSRVRIDEFLKLDYVSGPLLRLPSSFNN